MDETQLLSSDVLSTTYIFPTQTENDMESSNLLLDSQLAMSSAIPSETHTDTLILSSFGTESPMPVFTSMARFSSSPILSSGEKQSMLFTRIESPYTSTVSIYPSSDNAITTELLVSMTTKLDTMETVSMSTELGTMETVSMTTELSTMEMVALSTVMDKDLVTSAYLSSSLETGKIFGIFIVFLHSRVRF
jgi:hypothetical protein